MNVVQSPKSATSAIREALLAHRVIFFRDQEQADDKEQKAFSRLLGALVPHPTEQVREGSMGILELDATAGSGKADQRHTDVTFVDTPPRYSILRAVRIPEHCGDTIAGEVLVSVYGGRSEMLRRPASI